MNTRLQKIIELHTENNLQLEQISELKSLASELSEIFPDYESAIFMLARIVSISDIDKNAPKDAIDLEARFFEILNHSSNWDKQTKSSITKFTKFGSRISRIIDNSVSIRNSASGSMGPQVKMDNTERKYREAEQIYLKNQSKYGRYSAEIAAETVIEDYPGKKFSKRELQTRFAKLKRLKQK